MPLKVVARHGSPNLYLRGTVRGVTVDESTGVADKEQAEIIRAKREWEIINRQVSGRRAAATFLEAATSYLEGGGDSRFLEPVLDYFGTTKLSEIGQAEVEQCARKLYPGRKPSTINRQVFTPVSAVMTHAATRKMCDAPKFERPTTPRARVRWLTYVEADALVASCAEHMAPLVTFLLYTGARVGEALGLDWRDVDLARAHATFQFTKNGDRRGIPLHPRVVAALANLKHREGAVFRTDDGTAYKALEGRGYQLKTGFFAACRRAGITDFHPHDCRHTWATWHYAENRDLTALMALGGWKSLSMVTRYAHVNVDNLAAGVARLGARAEQQNPGSAHMGSKVVRSP